MDIHLDSRCYGGPFRSILLDICRPRLSTVAISPCQISDSVRLEFECPGFGPPAGLLGRFSPRKGVKGTI